MSATTPTSGHLSSLSLPRTPTSKLGLPSASSSSLSPYSGVGRRHSIYGTEDRVVVDLGSLYVKCGFSGESKPRHILHVPGDLRCHRNGTLCSESCRPSGESSELYTLDLRRGDTTILEEKLIHYFHQIYFKHLLTDPKMRKVILCESPLFPVQLKQIIAKVLFENLQVPSISFVPTHLLALLTTGQTTGLVVDCGNLETTVLPIFDARPLYHSIQTTPLAGKLLTKHLRTLINSYCYVTPLQSPLERLPVTEEILTPALLEEIKTRLLFVSPIKPINDSAQAGPHDVADFEERYAHSSLAADIEYCIPGTTKEPMKLFVPGWVRERAAELLFEGDEDERSLVWCILDCLLKLQPDLRGPLATSILVIGGTSMLPNFQPRLHQEIVRALQDLPKYKTLAGLAERLRFLDEKSGRIFPSNTRGWVGGK
ncbi:actin-domain-containing protein [Basidiobolus meristosporus CBS 931.73]|uniref:Actin-domain-containing protein n=1 Tax=Basidiobolus meristosporus CBS 931.73 TaxID=1314790 RepID=A0A1Y1YXW8_9FUNG|nr:actin-domain-containing protein [Basidiobolus meristosporus CBS 931.73]|eukprot:ORY02870.1 actin-domain-containing protein [Basidiobolus meristosporus CBS 931.73]